MGCCISHPFFEKETVYEVTLDSDGVAHRVPKGQGTHFIHVSPSNETHLEEKTTQSSATNKWPSLAISPIYTKRVHPTVNSHNDNNNETKEIEEKAST
ncbi:uncharacterized protein BX663DRAFT_551010 [Cokeromyces recurvatus]|uniref:uncharacterized protein n=1 Tax=Cokeromyces recurvatus TaxID=90255 RepID=UPI00221FB10B|nr:uncharacterized protein BX663DRAFT_551010 [Cokeromyces recurvatus]KAI7903945.1 hypothetical protein BX663DRAFT_551010 [Cokeromyces recurvatus]